MSNMQERHLQLAMDAKDPAEEALHRQAARLHAEAHLSEHHRRRAVAATVLAFDARSGGTVLAADEQERADDGKFGSGGSGKKPEGGEKDKKDEPTGPRSMKERHGMQIAAYEKAGDVEGARKHREAGEAHERGDVDADAKTGRALMHEPYIPFPGWQR